MKIKSDAGKKKRILDPLEEALWHRVKKTVSPIDDKRQNLDHWLDHEPTAPAKEDVRKTSNKPSDFAKAKQPTERQFPSPSYSPPVSRPGISLADKNQTGSIDDRTARKLLKGRVSIDARIDLHGMTQAVAHNVLKNFLYDCHRSGLRMVLVITGKGRMNEGILRQQVPQWLREPPLSLYVSAYRTSHVTHGGEGALYVRIRKQDKSMRRF